MKTICVLFSLVVVAAAFSDSEWQAYKKTYGKVYKSAIEDQFRLKIFLDRKARIDKHNAAGGSTYKRGINQFTDMTEFEVKQMMNGYNPSKNKKSGKQYVHSGVAAPDSMDWRNYGYVTGVKDQGQCGGCWAFSVVGSLEGQNFAHSGQLISFSEQQLVDCSTSYGLAGCEGGNNELAFEYVIAQGGIDTEDSYPYEARDNVCRFNPNTIGGYATSYSYIVNGGEDNLKDAVGSIGPISVAMDASHDSFQTYSSGIYFEPACSTTALDHAVLAVGYGNENGQDYWLIKNSWGTGWGEAGYFKLVRNNNNNCGIATDPSWPTL